MPPRPTKRRAHAAYLRALDAFFEFFNGYTWCFTGGLGPHYCSSPECCNNYDIDTCAKKAVEVIVSLMWRCMPVKPTKGKWTKLGPNVDWHMIGLGIQGILRLTYPHAFANLKVSVVKTSDDQEYITDVNWHALQGSRGKKYGDGLKNDDTIVNIIILAIMLEPIRFLTKWFMRRSSQKTRSIKQQRCRNPPICDLVWLHASPAVRTLQYLSCLLQGRAARLKLLWGRKYGSFKEWCLKEPDELERFRRTVLCVASWIHVRLVQENCCYPWLLASLIDDRRSFAEKALIAKEFTDASPDVLDIHFSSR